MSLNKKVKFFVRKLFNDAQLWDGAAALTFYILVGLFPGLFVLIAMFSFVSYEEMRVFISSWWIEYIPSVAQESLTNVVSDVSASKGAISILSFGFLFSIWTATTGVVAVMRQLNKVYGFRERRSFFLLRLTAVGIAFSLTLSLVFSFVTLVLGGFVVDLLLMGSLISNDTEEWINSVRLTSGGLMFFLGFSCLYRWGPNGKLKWSEILPGSLFATLILIFTSTFYSWYLRLSGSYASIYGHLGAIIGFLMWLYILSFVTLLGASVNKVFFVNSKGE